MENEILVHTSRFPVGSKVYDVLVYSRPDGSHVAKTVLDVDDVLINDGPTLDEALQKQCQLLPLAINTRQIFATARRRE